jgi:hypothetical protein
MIPLPISFIRSYRSQPASRKWLARQIAGLICLNSVIACELPRVGPTLAEIIADLNKTKKILLSKLTPPLQDKPQVFLPWAFPINSNQPPS